MSLLGRLGIRFDKHTLGNLLKNVSPALAFTPVGVAGAGGLAALGERLRGKTDLGSIARAGLSNAAIGGIAHAGAGALSRLGSAPGVAPVAPVTAPPVAAVGGPQVAAIPSSVAAMDENAIASLGSSSPLSAIGRGVGGALKFAEAHPTATAGALQAVGNLSTAGAENRLRNAQADALEQQVGETRYDFEQRKRREAALKPIWGQLGQVVGQTGYGAIAANPYASGGG